MLNIYTTSIEENKTKYLIISGLAGVMQSLGYSTCLYKPVQNDCVLKDDGIHSTEFDYLTAIDSFVDIKASYMFQYAPNPLIASVKEGKLIDRTKILKDFQNIIDVNECTIVEGIDGIGTPLNRNFLEINMMKDIDLPIIFIISPEKASMNNILATINNAVSEGLKVRGVIINDYPDDTEDENIKLLPRFIEEYTSAKVLGILPKIKPNIPAEELIDLILTSIDVEAVFEIAIAKLEK